MSSPADRPLPESVNTASVMSGQVLSCLAFQFSPSKTPKIWLEIMFMLLQCTKLQMKSVDTRNFRFLKILYPFLLTNTASKLGYPTEILIIFKFA